MQEFAQQNGGAGSHQSARPRSTNRQRVAANAKVQVTRTVLSHQQPAQKLQQQAPIHGSNDVQSHNAYRFADKRGQPAPPDRGTHVERGLYDTDAESLNTTQGPELQIQISDSQDHTSNRGVQYVARNQASDTEVDEQVSFKNADSGGEISGDDGGEEDEEGFDRSERRFLEEHGHQHSTFDTKAQLLYDTGRRQLRPTDRYGRDESYPATTSGVPSDRSHEMKTEISQESDVDEHAMSPTPQRPSDAVRYQSYHQDPAQGLNRPEKASEIDHLNQKQSVFQQGAAIRGQHQFETKTNVRPAQTRQIDPMSIPHNQHSTYFQATPSLATALNSHTQLPHNTPSQYQTQPTQRVKPEASVKSFAPAGYHIIAHVPTPAHAVHEDGTAQFDEQPVEDYDLSTLYNMEYSELEQEDFDTNPRAPENVFPSDISQKSLIERLTYAQQNFNGTDKAKLCRLLPTNEWEDAGDWFLDQFTDIIRRTREARKTKRKFAQDFEDLVEKRHKHVAKKQIQIEEALGQMQRQGQGLIPKSPRKSKSPDS